MTNSKKSSTREAYLCAVADMKKESKIKVYSSEMLMRPKTFANALPQIIVMKFSEATGIPLDKVYIDEILDSRRFKGFHFISSTEENQKMDAQVKEQDITEDVYAWFRN